MLTAIEIENFKSIGDRVRIELAPITLLFGANSSGKSTVMHAIRVAADVLAGKPLENFPELVHNHDLNSTMRLKVEVRDNGYDANLAQILGTVQCPFEVPISDYERFHLPSNLKEWLKPRDIQALINGEELQPQYPAGQSTKGKTSSIPTRGKVWRAAVEVAIQWRPAGERVRVRKPETAHAFVSEFKTWVNDVLLGDLRCDLGGKCSFGSFNYDHPIIPPKFARDGREWWAEALDYSSVHKTNQRLSDCGYGPPAIEEVPERPRALEHFKRCVEQRRVEEAKEMAEDETKDNWATFAERMLSTAVEEWHLCTNLSKSCLPKFVDRSAHLFGIDSYFDDDKGREVVDTRPEVTLPQNLCRLYFDFAFHDIGRFVKNEIVSYLHVGPIREADLHDPSAKSRGSREIGIWGGLANKESGLIEDCNHWLCEPDRLDLGIRLRVKRHWDISGDKTQPPPKPDLENLPTDRRSLVIVPRDLPHLELLPWNVGTGISQVVRIVAAGLESPLNWANVDEADEVDARNDEVDARNPDIPFLFKWHLLSDAPILRLIEQPELHLHPRVQTRLGDLFIEGKNRHIRFLIETHSEHLLLRLLRRIRQTTMGKLPAGQPGLVPEDVKVYFVEKVDGRSFIRKAMRIDETGELIEGWPAGFFVERSQELFDE